MPRNEQNASGLGAEPNAAPQSERVVLRRHHQRSMIGDAWWRASLALGTPRHRRSEITPSASATARVRVSALRIGKWWYPRIWVTDSVSQRAGWSWKVLLCLW